MNKKFYKGGEIQRNGGLIRLFRFGEKDPVFEGVDNEVSLDVLKKRERLLLQQTTGYKQKREIKILYLFCMETFSMILCLQDVIFAKCKKEHIEVEVLENDVVKRLKFSYYGGAMN